MKVQLPYLLLITIITITNFAGGELFLRMPMSLNPVVQDVVTERGTIVQLFSGLDPEYYFRLSPVDMVTRLDNSLSSVMRKTISGAVVLGIAAKTDGLTAEQLLYNSHYKWTVNVSLTDIRAILTADEVNLYPLDDNITLTRLESFGFRALQNKYNVSLQTHSEPLHSSNATTFTALEKDWIRVVNFITATNMHRLAAKHEVSVETLAEKLNLTSSELYNSTLGELDEILLKELSFFVPTTPSTTVAPPGPTTSVPITPNKSPTLPITIATSLRTTPTVGSETTAQLSSTKPSLNLVSSAAGKPTEGKGEGTATINLALFVGVAVGLLLLFVASSSVWCFRRKRRHSSPSEKPKNNNDIKLNNLWLDKTDNATPSSPEETSRSEQHRFVRSASTSTLGMDSRFKGLRYSTPRPSSSTFTECSTAKVPISRNSFLYDHRREIFV